MNPIKLFKVDKANAVYISAGVFLCGRCGMIHVPSVGTIGEYTNTSPRKRAEECCICSICKKPAVDTEAQKQGERIGPMTMHEECRLREASELTERREQKKLDNAELVEFDDYEGEGLFVGEQYYADIDVYGDALNDPDSELPDVEFGWAAYRRDQAIDVGRIWDELHEKYNGEDRDGEWQCSTIADALIEAAVDAFNKLNVGRGMWWPDDQLKVRLPRREKGADE